jgi:hypothetical protein
VKAAAVALLMAGATVPAQAQGAGTLEFQALGRFTYFDRSLDLLDRPGAGGRLGLFVLRNLALEGSSSFTYTDAGPGIDVGYIPIYGHLTYHLRLFGGLAFVAGPGFVHNEYRLDVRGADNGFSGLAGFRLRLFGALMIRAEGLIDNIPAPTNESDTVARNIHFGTQVGIGFLTGR